MKKYKVIERFTVDLISEVEAEDEEEARINHLNRVDSLTSKQYFAQIDSGTGNCTYEIEEIE